MTTRAAWSRLSPRIASLTSNSVVDWVTDTEDGAAVDAVPYGWCGAQRRG